VAPQFGPNFARFGAVAAAGARQNLSNNKNVLSFFFVFIFVFKFFLFFYESAKNNMQSEKLKEKHETKKTKKLKKHEANISCKTNFLFAPSKH